MKEDPARSKSGRKLKKVLGELWVLRMESEAKLIEKFG